MRTLYLLTMALLCKSATAAPVPKELRKCREIVGVWKLESATLTGVANDASETDWAISENFVLTLSGRRTQLKIDTATKEIDWSMGESILYGRYEVSGDQLTISLSKKNLPRATSLEPNKQNYVWVLRRAEK